MLSLCRLCGVSLLAGTFGLTPCQAASFDPLSADPAAFRVAIMTPSGYGLSKSGGALRIVEPDGANRASETVYPLEERKSDEGDSSLFLKREGETLHLLAIRAEDVEKLKAHLERLRKARVENPEKKGQRSLMIGANLCAVKGVTPSKPSLMSSAIKTDAASPYVQLLEDIDLSAPSASAVVGEIASSCD